MKKHLGTILAIPVAALVTWLLYIGVSIWLIVALVAVAYFVVYHFSRKKQNTKDSEENLQEENPEIDPEK